jgi:hypothetical protein
MIKNKKLPWMSNRQLCSNRLGWLRAKLQNMAATCVTNPAPSTNRSTKREPRKKSTRKQWLWIWTSTGTDFWPLQLLTRLQWFSQTGGTNSNFAHFFALNFIVSKFFAFFSTVSKSAKNSALFWHPNSSFVKKKFLGHISTFLKI